MTQHSAEQTGTNLLAALLQSSAAGAVVKGGMAALTLQFIEPHLDPTLLTEPSQSTEEFVPGHMVANIITGAWPRVAEGKFSQIENEDLER